jgi:signal transduction histidine kinase/ligand-binding sensor domain-containing protein
VCRFALGVVIACALVAPAHAERLAARVYTTADGLSNDRVDRGTRDPRGFLWFATGDGVSRFDGQTFTRFGLADGVPGAWVLDIAASRDGVIWASTEHGIAWLDPATADAHPRFTAVGPATFTSTVHEDATGAIWAGTENGLVLLRHPGGRPVYEPVNLGGRTPQIYSIAHDPRDNTLWLATWAGLWRRGADGAVERYRVAPEGERDDRLSSVLFDREHRLWLTQVSPRVIMAVPHPGKRLAPEGTPLWDAAAAGGDLVRHATAGATRRSLFEDARGTIWIGTAGALVLYDGAGFHELATDALPIDHALAPCTEDMTGNLWFGGDTQGLVRFAPDGFTAFDQRDGLDSGYIHGFVEPPGGPLYAITWRDRHVLARFDGARFESVRPRVPADVTTMAWGAGQTAFVDRDGAWWYPTGEGLARYAPALPFAELATTLPVWFARPAALPGRDIFKLYEDRRGDVWISTLSAGGLVRWDRARGELVATPGLPDANVSAFAEDASALWIGYDDGQLVRVHDGVIEHVGDLPASAITALLVDAAGRLWVTSEGHGVTRFDDPSSRSRRAVRYTAESGLASDQALSLVDDALGRMYVGTARGIDRIEPATGAIAHYDIADGLPNDYVLVAYRDRAGGLWFGTKAGIAHLVPHAPIARVVPPAYIARVAIESRPQPIAVDGARDVTFELGASDDRLDIAFTTPAFGVGDPVRFQYRLGDDAWSTPVAEREVHYARLAAGSYEFAVRAVTSSGAVSEPAHVSFVVVPPVWARWWFITGCMIVAGLAGYVVVRARLRHALAIERIRTRIATDLHDELGANLSRISILAEVATRREAADQPLADQVEDIGRSARELVEVASDIVWSTDPRRDDLGSLIIRLRRFAGDVLEGRGIAWSLTAPPEPGRIKLGPDQRRHLHLVAKEAIHNAAKHSEAETVAIEVRHDGRSLVVQITDDGRGFDLTAAGAGEGNGLHNMTSRARAAGGTLDVVALPGEGTTITLRLPLRGA